MNPLCKPSTLLLAAALAVAAGPVHAKRVEEGGERTGRSAVTAPGPEAGGVQRAGSQRVAAPVSSVAAEVPVQALDLPPPRGGRAAWFGSLASGLGVAALLSGLGLGPQAAGWATGVLLVLLLGALVFALWRLVRRWRPGVGGPLVYQGPGGGRPRPSRSSFAMSQYEPATLAPESSVHYGDGIEEVASRTGEFRWGVPAGFDAHGFLEAAKSNFVLLQEAWDRADLSALRALMTDDMLVHIGLQLQERGDQPNRTDVVTLQAELLGVEDVGATFLASVEFSGMIREEVTSGAAPFREVWNLTKPKDGSSGWLLAGVQALQ
ncbi:Tim44-like domain-containing protein [Aquabacterium sp. A7-Y]|uniref:Tim44 domain-containing protein n=1 Tax=Aquabacterium sp. A7-Y TaxID=1349605 RepID=UPI00223DEE47|nr:TIM44-like domain-containing protein [Aquabacterium sp. A7-Y]MCW7537314.1 Tim44-like domain-containing protein [Aquabacterium sp. A7-Y]